MSWLRWILVGLLVSVLGIVTRAASVIMFLALLCVGFAIALIYGDATPLVAIAVVGLVWASWWKGRKNGTSK